METPYDTFKLEVRREKKFLIVCVHLSKASTLDFSLLGISGINVQTFRSDESLDNYCAMNFFKIIKIESEDSKERLFEKIEAAKISLINALRGARECYHKKSESYQEYLLALEEEERKLENLVSGLEEKRIVSIC